jgi:NAD(P)-dependent dehydrogenase (short-subunit alcohol dehydrogenase family)
MRALVLGAETPVGRAIAAALAEAGAQLALVASSTDAETAFAVQRLARRSGAALSQAIDATNEMAVRVMVRQVSKALGGLEAIVVCAVPDMDSLQRKGAAIGLIMRFGFRPLLRSGEGRFAAVSPSWSAEAEVTVMPGLKTALIGMMQKSPEAIAAEVVYQLTEPPPPP